MKIIFNFILVITFIFKFYSSVISQVQSAGINNVLGNASDNLINPLYELRVGNFELGGSSPTGFNAILFDIVIYHTNLPESGPFEFSAGEYYFYFNPGVAHGGTLSFTIIPNSTEFTNPNAIPINPTIVGNQLRLSRNNLLGAGNGPIVSSVYPGTRVVRMKLETTAPSIDHFNLNLRWRDSTAGDPYTKTFAYIDSTSTDITSNGTLIIDDKLLPVELTNFTANINRNNVVLNWSTITETNNYGFAIERLASQSGSINNGQWSRIGFIEGNGTSSSQNNYSFKDNNLNSGRFQYRLKQIDYNGNYKFYDLQNEVIIGVPEKFFLSQNYPNPFNPMTKIDFDIMNDALVTLKLFDINGRQIKTLINEFKNSGYYTIEVDASALPSGVYYYRFESGNFFSTKKLILLK